MSDLTCLRCHAELDIEVEACPACGDKVTPFQRTYAGRLIDGKYQILERLGVGGMGEIFKVRHIHLGEQRVIKIMRANIASDDDALQRFLHEAKLATMIKHRSLAMLYDFSTLDDGSYYMVWEFIDGVNIQKWIAKNGPVPARLAVEIAIQALSGLETLHQMGIIHRDISPENIMLSQDYQGKLLAKVIDFGIAKQLSEGEGGQGLTATGMFLGKLKYASPEQAGFLKEGEHMDARSDLYSFGIVLYEMLAGRAPFLATNPHGYILKHATEKPPSFAEVNPNVKVPPKLEAVVFKSLEKDRNNRHASTAAFVGELEAIRGEIPPDEKYGLGERMITLSVQPTLMDTTMPRRQRTTAATKQAATVPRSQTKLGQMATGQQPTVVDKSVAGTLSGQPTVIERTAKGADAAATMVESLGGAAVPTLLEPKVPQWKGEAAVPTVLERKLALPAKKRSGMLIGLAAGVIIALGAGIYLAMQPDVTDTKGTGGINDTIVSVTSGTTATSTSGTSQGPLTTTAAESALLLFGGPYDQISRIENLNDKKTVELSALDDLSLPLRVPVKAGRYKVTLKGPTGKPVEQEVEVKAGQQVPVKSKPSINIDKIVNEVLPQ